MLPLNFLKRNEVYQLLGISGRVFSRLEAEGNGPPRTQIGRRCFYREEDVEAWVAAHTVPRPAARKQEAELLRT